MGMSADYALAIAEGATHDAHRHRAVRRARPERATLSFRLTSEIPPGPAQRPRSPSSAAATWRAAWSAACSRAAGAPAHPFRDPRRPRASAGRDFGIAVQRRTLERPRGRLWVLAVKPQMLHAVARPRRPARKRQRPLVVSIAAGITTAQLTRGSAATAVVRACPTRPRCSAPAHRPVRQRARVAGDQRAGRGAARRAGTTAGSTTKR
jgi:hypothetical protein